MTSRRPKLLFLSQALPYPPDGGVKIRTYNIMRQLARAFDVTALCFYRSKGGALRTDVRAALEGLSAIARVEAFPIPQEHSSLRFALDHLRSVLTRRAYTVASYESAAFRNRLRELLASESFDLVHADSLDLSGYFPVVSALPVVCVHHDAQSALLLRRARMERAAWKRAYLAFQSKLMLAEERRWCPKVSLNVAVSDVDRDTLLRVAPGSTVVVVPNGVDTDELTPRGTAKGGIVFVGGTTWFPNKDALEYFCKAILPELRKLGFDGPITWVGRASERERREYRTRYGLDMTGYVDDIRPFVDAALCYVVPIRVGGGTRIKILDAWALGKAIVSTSIGCEGLNARDGVNILVRDDPRDFSRAIQEVVSNHEFRRRLEASARQTAVDHYSWESIGASMRKTYIALLRPPT